MKIDLTKIIRFKTLVYAVPVFYVLNHGLTQEALFEAVDDASSVYVGVGKIGISASHELSAYKSELLASNPIEIPESEKKMVASRGFTSPYQAYANLSTVR